MYLFCFVFNLLRKGEEGGKVNPPQNTFFFLSNQPTLSRAPGFEGLMSQFQAVFKVAGGLKKLRGSPQVWRQLASVHQTCVLLRSPVWSSARGSGLEGGPTYIMGWREAGMPELCAAGSEGVGHSCAGAPLRGTGHSGDRAAETLSAWPRLGRTFGAESGFSGLCSSRCGKCCTKDLAKCEREPGKIPNKEIKSSLFPYVHQPLSQPCLSQREGGHSCI